MPEKQHDHPNEPRLLIPYWTGDQGDRPALKPLPDGVDLYMCPGIHASYLAGGEVIVEVDVRNWGGGNNETNAIVTVWWDDVTTSFATTPSNVIGVKTIKLAPNGYTDKTGEMIARIPRLYRHPLISLVARVHHPDDPAPVPGVERHWATRTILQHPAPNPGVGSGIINFSFWAANPYPHSAEFILRAQPVGGESLYQLARTVRADPIEAYARFGISETSDLLKPRSEQKPSHPYYVFLEAGARRSMHFRIDLETIPSEGQFAGFEILQYRRDQEHLVGGFALAVLAPDPNQR
jgi:hypothetical protein